MSIRRLSPAILVLALASGCTKPPAAPEKPALMVQVRSDPERAQVLLDGKPLGEAPRLVGIHTEEELLKLGAVYQGQELEEKRIRFLTLEQAEVTFLFGKGRSMTARALGLPRILVFDYGAGVTFDLDKAQLKPEFLPLLDRQARMLLGSFAGVDAYVCGHTDNLGTQEHNLSLSLARAGAVAGRLTESGVAKARLKILGFASQYPVADNGSEAGRALNRRTEVVLPQ